jgi:hypothetical protein
MAKIKATALKIGINMAAEKSVGMKIRKETD